MSLNSYLNVVQRYRLSGDGISNKIMREFNIGSNSSPFYSRNGYLTMGSFSDGIDFSFSVASHSVNLAYESDDSVIMKAHPDDVDAVSKYIADFIQEGALYRDRLVGDYHKIEHVLFGSNSVPAYDDSLDGVYEQIAKDREKSNRKLPQSGALEDVSSDKNFNEDQPFV